MPISLIPQHKKPQPPKNAAELIERWENVHRVLSSLDEHDRREHFKMFDWGRQTACGTVACAAGHCSLDAWFIERNFIGEIRGGALAPAAGRGYHFGDMVWDFFIPEIGGNCRFIAGEGVDNILYNGVDRSVEQVLKEIEGLLGELRDLEK